MKIAAAAFLAHSGFLGMIETIAELDIIHRFLAAWSLLALVIAVVIIARDA